MLVQDVGVVTRNVLATMGAGMGGMKVAALYLERMSNTGSERIVVAYVERSATYAQMGGTEDAALHVERMVNTGSKRVTVAHTALVTGYAQRGSREDAALYFEQTLDRGVLPPSQSTGVRGPVEMDVA